MAQYFTIKNKATDTKYSTFFFQVLSVFIEGDKTDFLYLDLLHLEDPTLVLVSDAVWQDGQEGGLFVLLFKAEVGVTPVG